MIDLNLKPVYKTIEVNGKNIKIPKLGLKHQQILNSGDLNDLFKFIDKSLTKAEKDIVLLHILNFNDRIKSEVEYKGKILTLNDVVLCQVLKFKIDDVEYRFKTPNFDKLKDSTYAGILNENCVSVKCGDEKLDMPDFNYMPAYVSKWVELIVNTISIEDVSGVYDIVELFDE